MCRWGIAAIVRSAAVCLEKATCDGWGGAAQRGCDKCGLPFGDQAAVVAPVVPRAAKGSHRRGGGVAKRRVASTVLRRASTVLLRTCGGCSHTTVSVGASRGGRTPPKCTQADARLKLMNLATAKRTSPRVRPGLPLGSATNFVVNSELSKVERVSWRACRAQGCQCHPRAHSAPPH